MPNKLQTLVQFAKNTFDRPSSLDGDKLRSLVSLTNDLVLGDVNLPSRLDGKIQNKVDYLPIHEDDDVTIGVFVMEQDAKIPIHDHPGMHGLLKVLHGELEITTYTVSNRYVPATRAASRFFYKTPLNVIKNPPIRLKPTDPCSELAPTLNNIHVVRCTAGPAAFLDILAPPYTDSEDVGDPRTCHYFKEIPNQPDGVIKLLQISAGEAWR